MTIDMSQFYQVFFEETAEHLNEMEQLLLNLDVDAPDSDDLNAIFRAAHSIKGGSGTFGFNDMTGVTHILETLLDRIRKGELAIRADMIDAFLEARDVLGAQLAGHQNGADVDDQAAKDVCEKLSNLAKGEDNAPPPQAAPAVTEIAPAAAQHTYRIEFTPDPIALENGLKIENLIEDLRVLGTLSVEENAATDDTPHSWKMSLDSDCDEAAIHEIFDFFAQPEQLKIEVGTPAEADPGYGFFDAPEKPQEQIEAEQGYGFFGESAPAKTKEQIEQEQGFGFFDAPASEKSPEQTEKDQGYGFFEEVKPPAATSVEDTKLPEPVKQALEHPTPQAHPNRRAADVAKPVDKTAQGDASIRVSVEKVDQLINLVGELVITQAMLAQTATKVDPVLYETLLNGLAQLERNTRDLQESVMSIRMMPIGFVFSRFPRVVRDLASKLAKKVELVTIGEGTELDKGLIEKLADPLTHLVRNSLDHGIEMPDKREAAGKPGKGTITLRASHQGGNIMIEVIDDGAGLNREKILAKAREKGIAVTDGMSDLDVFGLIFAPGFSTAEVVTDVSGRGVGMDVVKRNISEMGGHVEIESTLGIGTRIIIRLPLTLAILDGMSIAVGGEIFIMPLTYIAESLQPTEHDIKTISGTGRVVHVRGEYIPLLALYEVFGIAPKITDPSKGIVVLLEAEGKKAAMLVDELLGQHQVVIKSLETNYRKVQGISAATIMGDGKVALILDVGALVRMSQS